jgi:hypothetical protein
MAGSASIDKNNSLLVPIPPNVDDESSPSNVLNSFMPPSRKTMAIKLPTGLLELQKKTGIMNAQVKDMHIADNGPISVMKELLQDLIVSLLKSFTRS